MILCPEGVHKQTLPRSFAESHISLWLSFCLVVMRSCGPSVLQSGYVINYTALDRRNKYQKILSGACSLMKYLKSSKWQDRKTVRLHDRKTVRLHDRKTPRKKIFLTTVLHGVSTESHGVNEDV
jgi:hypothetical protein